MSHPEYSPGLQGVVAGITHISDINVERSVLTYRGYDVHILAEKCSFEEVAYLVLHGDLPTKAQFGDFNKSLRGDRELPDGVYEVLRLLPKGCHPMDTLKVGATALALYDAETCTQTHDANMRKAIRIIARMPALVANSYRMAYEGKPPVAPDPSLSIAGDFLHMLHDRKPTDLETNAINASLIVYAEHGYNAR